jgi:hypothetical protein
VTSTLLLILVGMASVCIVSFLRGYQKFDQESGKVRAQLTTLDRLSSHARSARSLKSLEPLSITVQTPQSLVKEDFVIESGQLYLKTDKGKSPLGPAEKLQLDWHKDGLLYIHLDGHLAVVDWTELLP